MVSVFWGASGAASGPENAALPKLPRMQARQMQAEIISLGSSRMSPAKMNLVKVV
jgi:hypothetical protein